MELTAFHSLSDSNSEEDAEHVWRAGHPAFDREAPGFVGGGSASGAG